MLMGLLVLVGTAYFIVVQPPPTFQAAPAQSEVTRLQEEGVLPMGPFAANDKIEEGVFEVPAMDEMMLEAAADNMDMGAMNMGGMDMSNDKPMDKGGDAPPVLDMDMNGDGVMDMSSSQMNPAGGMQMAEGATQKTGGMKMPDGSTMDMSGGAPAAPATDTKPADGMQMAEGGAGDMGGMKMPETTPMDMGNAAAPVLDMDMNGDGVMDMSSAEMKSGGSGSMAGMNMPGNNKPVDMADSEEADRMKAGMLAGLMVSKGGAFDREIKLSMTEWGFSNLNIDVKPGERIKFTLRNDGQILHEFMFMSMAGMQGVNYRAKRADWNLLEHEALFEQSLMLPGEEITFVATIIKPGVWMFMCMLPYHMQMGMMGQMATEGMAMEM